MSAPSPDPARGAGPRPGLTAGAAFVGLTLLLRLPDLASGGIPIGLSEEARAFYWEGPLRVLSLDLFALVSLLALAPVGDLGRDAPGRDAFGGNAFGDNWGRRARAVFVGSVAVLLAYETYEAVVVALLHRQPLFAADASHAAAALHLSYNALSPSAFLLGLAGLAAVAGLLAWGLPRLTGRLHAALRAPAVRRGLLAANLVAWPLVAFAAVDGRGIERQTYQAVCLSTTEAIVRNVQASRALQAEVAARQARPADSTYRRYWGLNWERPPSLYLVVLESYGTVLAGDGGSLTQNALDRSADSLRAGGWHLASAQSRAPVVGGLSWLSVASTLLGTPVRHQPLYERLRPTLNRYPHLVRLLKHQGYRTAVLQPPVRARPGLSVGNPYGFDRTFYFADLDYEGPRYGWGIVPDQYSLSVAHERFVAPGTRPFFLLFETATSHAPWNRPPPPLVATPEVLNQSRPAAQAAPAPNAAPPPVAGPGSGDPPGALARHVEYGWRLLVDHLRRRAPPNSLVVVMGDHQPYVAGDGTATTPVHVLSRDAGLVRRFRSAGFRPGLHLTPETTPTLHHAGLYSLVVRALTAHSRPAAGRPSGRAALPPYLPTGVRRAALHPARP